MAALRGYILVTGWFTEAASHDVIDYAKQLTSECRGHFRTVSVESHNTVTAISFFDFSNHLGNWSAFIPQFEQKLMGSEFVVEALIRISDKESEVQEHRFEISRF